MFFIGIFSSPLPYMFLVAVYLSGYAFFFFESHTGISEAEEIKQVDGWVAPAIPHPADTNRTCFFYDDNLPLADVTPALNLSFLFAVLPMRVHLPETHGRYAHLPGKYSIRPPPAV